MAPPIIFEALQQAIEQLRPELPALIGTDYLAFEAQLDSSLKAGSVNRVLDLFRQHGAAHQRLLQTLPSRQEDLTKGLYGDVNISLPYLYFLCPVGPHVVQVKVVEDRDAPGRPLCPVDDVIIRRIGSEDLRTAVEKVRAELPQLLGPECVDFVAKLNTSLAASGDDRTWELLRKHDVMYRRFLQILAAG